VIKVLLLGIWVCVLALGSSYVSAHLMGGKAEEKVEGATESATEFIKSDMISVPVIRTGKVQGYVVAQFTFVVDAAEIAKLHFEPNPFLFDAAFRCLYENQTTDFSSLQQQDLTELVKQVMERANKKLGMPIAKDVLLTEINYVSRDEVRTNWVKKQN
jgi:hypothetical protein